LDFNGKIHCIDGAAELDNRAIAGSLDDPAVMHRNGRINEVASERPQPRQNPVLVGSREPRIADDISDQDGRELAGLAQLRPSGCSQITTNASPSLPKCGSFECPSRLSE
jgi:hypothetical protein